MMLYLIGLGLNDEKDISIKGLEAVKKCEFVYLEYYTSKLNIGIKELEKIYKKKIIIADRNLIENSDEVIKSSEKYDVALLIIGDVFSATTHINFIIECKKRNIKYEVIHNASILTAIGETGLELYKFGKTTSIPFDNEDVRAPIEAIKSNLKSNLHTLILLDLDTINGKYLSANEALKYLAQNGIPEKMKVLVCCQLGGNSKVAYSEIRNLLNMKFDSFPQCIIVPSGKLHFIEEEALSLWRT
ncbi:MAG: diphthine synthase [Nanoarchaeota archaeon]